MEYFQSVRFRIKFQRVLRIGLLWMVAGALDAWFTDLLAHSYYLHPTERYHFPSFFLGNLIGFWAVGMISGYFLIFHLRDRFRQHPFLVSLLLQSVFIVFMTVMLSLAAYLIFYSILDEDYPWSQVVWNSTTELFFSPYHVKNEGMALLLTMFTILFLRISDKYGPNRLMDSLIGKFHHPRQEERIFMFADIRSSTSIAERIGHIRFHQLLDDFFRDITDAVLYSSGEIYQYVGDEVVITWTMENGLRHGNCIRCFFAMQEALSKKAAQYRRKYGLAPEFKAGLHCGPVTTGEIGIIKRDIVHSGDVLNTTARIQSICNDYGVKILLSRRLLEKLNLPPDSYIPRKIGDIDLKGKRKKVILYTLAEPNTLAPPDALPPRSHPRKVES